MIQPTSLAEEIAAPPHNSEASALNFFSTGGVYDQQENFQEICYCFGYSRRDIEQDFIKNDRSLILEKISTEKKAGGCDCAAKNPKGR